MKENQSPKWRLVIDGELPLPANWMFGATCDYVKAHNNENGKAIRRRASTHCVACENAATMIRKSKTTARKVDNIGADALKADHKREEILAARIEKEFNTMHLRDIV